MKINFQKLNARELRTTEPDSEKIKHQRRNPVYIILDNVLDTYNVGAIFRLGDACAVKKIYLCGQTETPPNPRIKKASVSTWKWVDWEYSENVSAAITKLKNEVKNISFIAIEQDEKSKPLQKFIPVFPLCIIVGNESIGVGKDNLKLADEIIELPMFGVNKSLNVMVCLGVVLYRAIEYL